MDIKLNELVEIDGVRHRIIDIRAESILLIGIDTSCLQMQRIATSCFLQMEEQAYVRHLEAEKRTEPVEKLSFEELEEINRKERLINGLLNEMYPYWEDLQSKKSKPELKKIMDELALSRCTVLKLIRRYLQSGRDKYALMDQRQGAKNRNKSGQSFKSVRGVANRNGKRSNVLNDAVLAARFEEGLQYFLSGSRNGITLAAAYNHMIREHYTDRVVTEQGIEMRCKAKEDRPSYERFWYYCKKSMDRSVTQCKKDRREVRNNERLLLGNAQSEAYFPGQILEIDEVEMDLILLASDGSSQVVGRPVMYLAVDKFSSCIVGCSVEFENNSYVGVMNLFETLLFDHNVQTEPYGVSMPKEIYPSCFLPSEIQTDQGAEYVSKEIRRVGRELGIEINLSPPGMGSLKGTVEQSFHQYQEMLRTTLAGKGVILKQVDSKHYETACLDIHDVRAIAFRYIAWHNQHIRADRGMTREMVEAGIEPRPCLIWRYGMEHCSKPLAVTDANRENVFWALCREDRSFRISRSGIKYKGLYYYQQLPWLDSQMICLGNKTEILKGVRYDPRDVSVVYMMKDGKVVKIGLNETRGEQASYQGMKWDDYDKLFRKQKETVYNGLEQDLSLRIQTESSMEEIGEAARKMREKGKNRKKGIRESRKTEASVLRKTDAKMREAMGRMDNSEQEEAVFAEAQVVEMPKRVEIHYDDDDFSDMDDFFGQ